MVLCCASVTALISITDFDDCAVELINKPDFLLRVTFDDVDNDVIVDELRIMLRKNEFQIVEEKYHMLFVLGAVLITFAAYQLQMLSWRFTNYFPVINQALDLPPEVLVIYPASESYPVLWNSNGQAAERYAGELQGSPRKLMLIKSTGEITGGDENFSQQSEIIPVQGEIIDFSGVKAAVYTLEPVVDQLEADIPLIGISYSTNAVKALAGKENVLMLNIFFKNALLPDNRILTATSWYIKPGALNKYVKTGISAGDVRLYKIKALP